MTAALEARGVSVNAGGRRIVSAVDLTVARGEWVVIIGPNGAGKTTVLRAFAGIIAFAGGGRVRAAREDAARRLLRR